MIKKSILFITILFALLVTNVFADYNGENLFGQNFCQKVDRYNFTNITSISFVTSNLYYLPY